MGFFDTLVNIGSSALKALDENAKKSYIATWNIYKRKNSSDLLEIIRNNETISAKRSIALAACKLNGYSVIDIYDRMPGGKYDNEGKIKRDIERLYSSLTDIEDRDAKELRDSLKSVIDNWIFFII